LAGAGGRT